MIVDIISSCISICKTYFIIAHIATGLELFGHLYSKNIYSTLSCSIAACRLPDQPLDFQTPPRTVGGTCAWQCPDWLQRHRRYNGDEGDVQTSSKGPIPASSCRTSQASRNLGGGFKHFLFFTPTRGGDPIWQYLTKIFQMGWFNHQPEIHSTWWFQSFVPLFSDETLLKNLLGELAFPF